MILVTGANGYIGSLLMQRLSQWGESAFAFDGDASDPDMWMANMHYCHPVSGIVHLAAKTNLRLCEKNPELSFMNNYWSAVLAAKYAREADCPLVFVSTNTDRIYDTVYESDKRSASLAIASMRLNRFSILRLATVYGTTFADSASGRGIINHWVKEGLAHRPIVVYREVMNKRRDFVHVSDVVKHIGIALYGGDGNYDVCTGRCITMLEAADQISKLTESTVFIEESPEALYPVELRDETSYSYKALDNDFIPFEEGVKGMICGLQSAAH